MSCFNKQRCCKLILLPYYRHGKEFLCFATVWLLSATVTCFHCVLTFSYALCCFKVLHGPHDQLSCSSTNNMKKTYRAAIWVQPQHFLFPWSLMHCEPSSGHIRFFLKLIRAKEKDGRRRRADEMKFQQRSWGYGLLRVSSLRHELLFATLFRYLNYGFWPRSLLATMADGA